MSTTTLEPQSTQRKLDIVDRCDRCGAQAYVRATLTSGGQLLFCGHHGRQHEDKLRPLTSEWLDETSHINAKPTSSANA